MVDLVAEPNRKKLIPLFDDVKQSAISAGALGAGISGSGPSIFALSKNIETAKKVEKALDAFYKNSGIEYSTYVSHISKTGTRIL